ncbi:hypothetical protein WICPIJ_009977 [Wickerhamomyces pijperi]|uniref:Integral membrane protein n=1 Tax=Wickerhamomyces pijperi TaxID=599730 RepID=A0A9P8PIQ5_WICPI|nr:hypothetical protein WICPIJ_009977 [Wickerhamomyces pijperi]
MKPFVTIADVPVGYTTPPFPSLYWPLGQEKYTISYLYYSFDIWKFTVFWTLIVFAAFYGSVGIWAGLLTRRIFLGITVLTSYLIIGSIQAFISASIFSVVLAATYRAGLFAMTTWIPFSCAVIQMLFNVLMSYTFMSVVV